MQGLVNWVSKRSTDETGATAVEYGLLAALIAVVMAVGAAFLGEQLKSLFDRAPSARSDSSHAFPAPMVGDEQIPRSEPARRGGLSNIDVDTLEAAHPGEGVAEFVAMHALIGGLTVEPDAERGPSPDVLRASLPAQAPLAGEGTAADRDRRRGVLMRRLLVALLT